MQLILKVYETLI